MTTQKFAPKDAETLKTEITTELGIVYEGNEDLVDKMVAREVKSEEFKASLHADKVKHLARKDFYKQQLEKAGIDPQTGTKKSNDPEKPTPKNDKYSLEEIDDIAALTSVPKEDRAEVLEHAKYKGITPAEALKSTYIKTFLREQEELRKSANAANTGGSKRGASKPTGEKILEDFHSGKIPESEEGIKDLVDAQWANKKKK